jgi:FtsP/CotA-like multicopper oxidase with cupredoxin domain
MSSRPLGWVLLLAACGGDGNLTTSPPVERAGGFIDLNPDPGIVEVSLIAGPAEVEILDGKMTPVWAYRDGADPESQGSVPGPLLELEQGQELVVHFQNHLEAETTIHWHGIRLDPSMDGSHVAQMPVPPGGTFTYSFTALDPGFYWYHPHLEADVQIEAGLQAPLVIRGGVAIDVSAERLFVIDDVKIESTGELSQVTTPLDLMVGRMGNVRTVNGKRAPVNVTMATGGRERWRFVNTANGRFFNLTLPGTRLLVIGWDGGLVTEPYEVDTLLIAPGERYEVLVEPKAGIGESLVLQDIHYDRGHDLPDEGPKALLTIEMGEPPANPLAPLPERWGTFEPIDITGTSIQTFTLTEVMSDEPEFFINGEKWPQVTPTRGIFGATEVWEIVNDSEMDHPFHLHGMFFQVLEVAGVTVPPLAFKDTFIVPRETNAHIAVTYDAAGDWVYHCHILEHAERGMMSFLRVE